MEKTRVKLDSRGEKRSLLRCVTTPTNMRPCPALSHASECNSRPYHGFDCSFVYLTRQTDEELHMKEPSLLVSARALYFRQDRTDQTTLFSKQSIAPTTELGHAYQKTNVTIAV